MSFNILGFAVPLFIGFMWLEYYVARKQKMQVHNLHNSIANISIGIAERLCDVFVAVLFYSVYDTIQKKYGLFTIKPSISLWILLFLLTDFVWYWYHRLGHEVNLFWMAHIVHHQSEDFNYTTSARITVFQAFIRTSLWAVLPFIGFPASMITSLLIVHGVYPFFIHTQLVGNLGVLEYLFVTPSHHRVHHASNPEYLDKNYGDVLIIWDKLFGTFKKEDPSIKIEFGLTKPLKTYSFLWQHFHYWFELVLAVKQTSGFLNKIKVVLGRPDSMSPYHRDTAEIFFGIRQAKTPIGEPLNKYVIWQMVLLLISLFAFLLFEHYLSLSIKISFSVVVILTLINCGAIMEQKKWIFIVEFLRLISISFLSFYSTAYWQIKLFIITILALMIILFYSTTQRLYLQYVYCK